VSQPDLAAQRQKAEQLLAAGDTETAESILDVIVAAAPDDSRAWHFLGTARYRNGRIVPAVAAYRQRLILAPNDALAHYSLAIALRDLGEQDEARQHLVRAIELKPDFAEAQTRLRELDQPQTPKPPVAPPPHVPVAAPPNPPEGAPGTTTVGRARHIQIRTEADSIVRGASKQRLTFRVERIEEGGSQPASIPVEMRGARIDGSVTDGDWVEVPGRWHPGQTLRPTTFLNLMTLETIKAKRGSGWIMLIVLGLFAVAFVAFFVWGAARTDWGPFRDDIPPPPGQAQTDPGLPVPQTTLDPVPETDPGVDTTTDDPGPTTGDEPGTGDAASGAAVFSSGGCGGCHTLAAAGSSGAVGPNLDETQPSTELVIERVTNGSGAMPSFADKLTAQEILDVAAYVVESTQNPSDSE
jgi:mono/diheme cytochrome c family protein